MVYFFTSPSYDVWLANVRGNKYCREHDKLSSTDKQFWDFDLDDLIEHDIPAIIDAVLNYYPSNTTLSIVAFSQGTTLTMGFLSQFPTYHKKIDKLIMLAATGRPRNHKTINRISKLNFDFIKGIFGNGALLEEIIVVIRAILPSSWYSSLLKYSMSSLFDWKFESLSQNQTIYSHLYCSTSVSLILHWFHIIRNEGFFRNGTTVPYALNKIPKEKVFFFFGQRDTLEDKGYLIEQIDIPTNQYFTIPNYEHLDFLWSPHNSSLLYPIVLNALSSATCN